jgi:SAM-dependent methyltransferase
MRLPDPYVHANGNVKLSSTSMEVTADALQWAALASWRIALQAGDAVIVRARSRYGRLSASLFSAEFSGLNSNEEPLEREAEVLLLPDQTGDFHLVIRNMAAEPGAVELLGFDVVRVEACPASWIKRARAHRYPYWHYSFDLGDGVCVEANLGPTLQRTHELKRRVLDGLIEEFFLTKHIASALDIGCSSGFHTLALARRGWRVKGIDIDPGQIHQARLVQECLGSKLSLEFQVADVLTFPAAPYDLVHCTGLLYHLKDIYGACLKIYECALKGAVIQSCVDTYEGKHVRLHDHETIEGIRYNGPYEFVFVPTMEVLCRCFREVGFSEVRAFRALDRIDERDIADLSPATQKTMRQHMAYIVLTK